ncbi:hypothetical protein GW931_00650 [archaeon]|nr:hypothetical protein [archaeon]PJC45182.1 MAG: hypothetical protein CO037_02830 [Candidatus Pacearchaeota archaeon CG_4_9_14_0_2_um_filter_30_8]
MDEETKEAFDHLLYFLVDDPNLYHNNVKGFYKKNLLEFSVYGLSDIVGNLVLKHKPKKFGLDKEKSDLITEYFQKNKIEYCINELYEKFPSNFSGEPRWRIDPTKVEKYVPTYDESDIEKN